MMEMAVIGAYGSGLTASDLLPSSDALPSLASLPQLGLCPLALPVCSQRGELGRTSGDCFARGLAALAHQHPFSFLPFL